MDADYSGVVTFDEFMEYGGMLLASSPSWSTVVKSPAKSVVNSPGREELLGASVEVGWGTGTVSFENHREEGEDAVEEALWMVRHFEELVAMARSEVGEGGVKGGGEEERETKADEERERRAQREKADEERERREREGEREIERERGKREEEGRRRERERRRVERGMRVREAREMKVRLEREEKERARSGHDPSSVSPLFNITPPPSFPIQTPTLHQIALFELYLLQQHN